MDTVILLSNHTLLSWTLFLTMMCKVKVLDGIF